MVSLLELIRWSGGALIALWLILATGQLAQLAQLLWPASATNPQIILRVLGYGTIILLEPVLPLVPLIAAGLAFGRARAEGALMAVAAVGVGPLRVWATPLVIGLFLGGLGGALAQSVVPNAVRGLRGVIVDAAAQGLTAGRRSIRLPGGGAIHVGKQGSDTEVWAMIPQANGVPWLLHARDVSSRHQEGAMSLEAGSTWLWGPHLRVQTRSARLEMDTQALQKKMGMFGPPNALDSDGLDNSAHHQFTWHRRWSLAACAPLWALLGALLGGRFGGARAVILGAALVGGAYWLLRTGELAARAGMLWPAWAAWAPTAALLFVTVWAWIQFADQRAAS